MKYEVTYSTMNDTYTKDFNNLYEAECFCQMIHQLYPEQNPLPVRR